MTTLRKTAVIIAVLATVMYPACSQLLSAAEIDGYKFFDSGSGDSIAFKGIDYYPRPNSGILNKNNVDFFTEEFQNIWERDIPIFKELGVNAIRLYAVDPTKDHDAFMCALQEAGIYVVVGMAANCYECAIMAGASPPDCYPAALKTRGQMIISAFAKYDNVVGFSAGNEVDLVVTKPQDNAPCQKKFIRDMRKYIQDCPGMRHIPVGVVISDAYRQANAMYYNCQGDNDPLEHAEWLGLNAYQHCQADITDRAQANGYQIMKNDFGSYNYSIPVLLTEFGCLNPSFPTINGYQGQRSFEQAQWPFETDFRDVFAGGFAFEYSTEKDNAGTAYPFDVFGYGNYGIGYFSPETCNDVDIDCDYIPKPEFYNLKAAYDTSKAVGVVSRASFTPESHRVGRSKCPSEFPLLSDYTWPSDLIDDLPCTDSVYLSCGTRAPTVSPKPSPSPTQEPTLPLTMNCECASCTKELLSRTATDGTSTYTCGDRIEWLQYSEGMSERDACVRISSVEFPNVCGPACDPNRCSSQAFLAGSSQAFLTYTSWITTMTAPIVLILVLLSDM